MQSKRIAETLAAVVLTALVLGSAGVAAASPIFLASAGPRANGILGTVHENAPTTSGLTVTVMWCSDWTAEYCVPIGGAAVTVASQNGTTIATGQSNANGEQSFSVSAPATYKVTADISSVSAFGYMGGAEYQMVNVTAGASTHAVFQYIQDPPTEF